MDELSKLAERFLSAPVQSQHDAFKPLVAALRHAINCNRTDEATVTLRQVTLPTLDYTSVQSLHRVYRQLSKVAGAVPNRTRLAVTGSFTTNQLAPLVELFLFTAGVSCDIHEGDFGVFRQDILDPESSLYQFDPQFVFLATSWRDLGERPQLDSNGADVGRMVASEQASWTALWARLHERLSCQVLQNNFVLPPWRPLGNHERRHPGSLSRFLNLMNDSLVDSSPPYVTIHDVDHLASTWGRWNWDDLRYVHVAKMPCAPEYLVDYAHSVASIVAAQLGMAKKCLVLDLDNTLWGGVIGDDGLGGVRLGQGDAEGEAFLAWQEYIKKLQLRGVILAVCSKNQEATAMEMFRQHPEMVLRLDDVACFVANWNDKATNLRTIAGRLNIGLNSLVFVDDNPAERAIVRQLVPEVAVPELPDDVTGYIQAVEQHRYFQVLSVGTEDLQRAQYYRADALRREAQATAADIDGYLESLDMVARIGPINETTLERSAQLIQRSNQFNLTSRRHSAAELLDMVRDDSTLTVTVSLADRFGDNGLISVLLAFVEHETLRIDTWLMSCRVLKRGVESLLLNYVCDQARQRDLKAIRGEYLPTAKNTLVREHYASLGFTQIGAGAEGATFWELKLPDISCPAKHFIRELASHEHRAG